MSSESEPWLQPSPQVNQIMMVSMPDQVKKNFTTAFNKLCGVAVGTSVSWIEDFKTKRFGFNEIALKLSKTGEDSNGSIQIPENYATRATTQYLLRIVKEQLNLDEIVSKATDELALIQPLSEDSVSADISEDWLNEFEQQARFKSSTEMKIIFGKILAGEISKPGTFSIRAIRLISQLDNQAAKLFQVFKSLCVAMRVGTTIYDARVISFDGNVGVGSNSLVQFGLSVDGLNVLHEYGLIISDYSSAMNYFPCIIQQNNTVAVALSYGNKEYRLLPTDKENYDKQLQLQGVSLSKAGKELFDIVSGKNNDNYTRALVEFFAKRHLRLIEL